MALTIETLRDVLLASLPNGPMWPRAGDSQWGLLFEAIAPEFVEIDELDQQLIKEMSPHTASLLFDEWEAELGLPDACHGEGQTYNQRHFAMKERYSTIGRQDKQFFIDLAARLGYTITIDEFSPSNPGPAGNLEVVKQNGETFHVSPSGDEWNYVWRVNAPSTVNQPRQYPSQYGEPYTIVGNDLLECTLRQYAHEHRVLIFAYV
ncbi:MAG: hypothetical protein C9356_12535 [Oleiphilus sp.]|nr:MAG: hypothetical protein C9356_12535 [Oleiphilus sp.]